MPTTTETADRILTRAEVAKFLSVAERTLERLAKKGSGPAFLRISERRIGYRLSAINEWLDGRVCLPKDVPIALASSGEAA